ncbi:MAG: YezD family protein [Nitrospira sp.]|nr:YezD family protein [Nitrospira sp.]
MSRSDQDIANPSLDWIVEQAIMLALKGIRFGSVEIIIHDSKVVQIERNEKKRKEKKRKEKKRKDTL